MSSFDSSAWMFLHMKHRFWKHCVEFFVTILSVLMCCTVCKPSWSCKSRLYILHVVLIDGKVLVEGKSSSLFHVKSWLSMLCFGSYLLQLHLASDWSQNNKHSKIFFWCLQFYGTDFKKIGVTLSFPSSNMNIQSWLSWPSLPAVRKGTHIGDSLVCWSSVLIPYHVGAANCLVSLPDITETTIGNF